MAPADRAGMRFRPATEADFPAICALIHNEEELFLVYPRGSFPLTPEQLRHLAATRADLTVVTINATVAGFANLYDVVPGKRAFIGNVIVDPARRGQGIGRELMKHMIDRACREHALPAVCVSVFSHNTRALLLYTRLGFSPEAVEERVDFAGNRRALLHLRLPREDRAARQELAEAVRSACVAAAIAGYEQAGMSGLCAEGRWEAAVGAMQGVNIAALLRQSGKSE